MPYSSNNLLVPGDSHHHRQKLATQSNGCSD